MNELTFLKVVPKDRLAFHVEKEGMEPKGTQQELYENLIHKNNQVAEDVYSEYEFAGKTSLNLFEIKDFPQTLNNKKKYMEHVKSKLGINTRIDGVILRPTLSTNPKVHLIKETSDGYMIQWVEGQVKKHLGSDYTVKTEMEPKFTTTFIHFGSPIFIEVRAGYKMAISHLKMLQLFLSNKEAEPLEFTWIPVTKVSEIEAAEIGSILDAGLVEGEHLGSNGIGRYVVSADRNTEDLRNLKEYQDNYSHKKYLAQTLNVKYEDPDLGYKTTIKFRISMYGGFEFKTKVSEKIIKRIFDVFLEVRYKKSEKASGE